MAQYKAIVAEICEHDGGS